MNNATLGLHYVTNNCTEILKPSGRDEERCR